MRTLILMLVLIALGAGPVFADGGCPERPANQQESTAYQSVYKAAKAAVPPAPADWVVKDETEANTGATVPKCSEGPNDHPLCYRIKFKYTYSHEASERVQQIAVNNALKGNAAQQVKLAELDRKIDDLEGAKQEARKNHDRAEKERVREELKSLKKERRKIQDEINNANMQQATSGQLTGEIEKNKPARKEAELVIKVNENHAWVPVRDTPVSIPGASQAYWCKEGDAGRLVILLGTWDAKFKANLAKTSVVTKAQNMLIEITGERHMAENLARQMKLDLLKKQL